MVSEWSTIPVLEARVNGKLYRIEQPDKKNQEVNVYCNGEFIGPARSIDDAKDSIAKGLC